MNTVYANGRFSFCLDNFFYPAKWQSQVLCCICAAIQDDLNSLEKWTDIVLTRGKTYSFTWQRVAPYTNACWGKAVWKAHSQKKTQGCHVKKGGIPSALSVGRFPWPSVFNLSVRSPGKPRALCTTNLPEFLHWRVLLNQRAVRHGDMHYLTHHFMTPQWVFPLYSSISPTAGDCQHPWKTHTKSLQNNTLYYYKIVTG